MSGVQGLEQEIARVLVAERTRPVRHPLRRHPRVARVLRGLAERLDPQLRPAVERPRLRTAGPVVAGH